MLELINLYKIVSVEEYLKKVQTTNKGLYWVENADHLAVLDNQKRYNAALLELSRN